jgi:uncharacterized membrane protein YgcG
MRFCIWIARWLASAIAAVTLVGCAVVDQYSGRAVAYNVEAENAQEQAILLNIIRASLRRPMQFTTVSNIVGTATASGNVGYTAPVNIPFRPAVFGSSGIAPIPSLLNAWSFGGSMSGGPTFTVPVLDTQEFYQGILRPIPTQLWDLYLHQGYSQNLLFNLFVERIVIRKQSCESFRHGVTCELPIENYATEDAEIDLFQIFANYLIWLGLSTELEKEESLLRPDKLCEFNRKYLEQLKKGVEGRRAGLSPDEAYKQAYEALPPDVKKDRANCDAMRIRNAMNVNVKVSGSLGGLSGQSSPSGGSGGATGGGSSGGETSARKYGLCFAPRDDDAGQYVDNKSKCGRSPQGYWKAKSAAVGDDAVRDDADDDDAVGAGEANFHIRMSADMIDEMNAVLSQCCGTELGQFFKGLPRKGARGLIAEPVKVQVHLRSTEGMIYYLGEVARRQLSSNNARTIYFANQHHYAAYPKKWECTDGNVSSNKANDDICTPIFQLNVGPRPGSFLSTFYEGVVYSVPSDGRSGQVLEIVKQALALSSSSKSLPQSNVVSLVGGQ